MVQFSAGGLRGGGGGAGPGVQPEGAAAASRQDCQAAGERTAQLPSY